MTPAIAVGIVFFIILVTLFILALTSPKETPNERAVQRQELPREDSFAGRNHRDFWRH
jgi:uncharacterized membrane protein